MQHATQDACKSRKTLETPHQASLSAYPLSVQHNKNKQNKHKNKQYK